MHIFLFFQILALFSGSESINPHSKGSMTQVSGKLLVDMTEVSNGEYLEFMDSMKVKGFDYLLTAPDTTVWENELTYSKPFVEYYFRHRAYSDYPVVGVNYHQAISYCRWKGNFLIKSGKFEPVGKVQAEDFRLLTEAEWKTLALAGFPEKTIRKHERKELPLHNLKDITQEFSLTSKVMVTAPVFSYSEDNSGLFNITGNLAEMVMEEGIAMGGSWFHTSVQSGPDQVQEYKGATAWLGFRCACEIK